MRNGMVEYADGSIAWYKDDKLHREDGPAVEYSNGNKAWYKKGKRHRLDGPAVEWKDGDKEWWLNGELVYEDEYDCTSEFNLPNIMKRSIVKYKLEKMK